MRPRHCKSLMHIYILQCLVKHHCRASTPAEFRFAKPLVPGVLCIHSPIQPPCKSPPWLWLTVCIPNPGWTAADERPVPGAAEIISDSPSLPPWNETGSSFTGAGLLSSGSREFCVGSGMQLKNLLQVTRILCDSSVEENVRSCPLCYSWVRDNWEFPVVLVRWHLASHSNHTPYPERRGMVKIGCLA